MKKRDFFLKLKKLYPNAECALRHQNPFELLVATILSAQCTDSRVNLVTPVLFQQAATPEAIVKLGEDELANIIKTCGLYHSKAKNILATCRMLLKKYKGKVPKTLDELTALPGVGRKTANVVLSNAFGVPAIAVDTHVFRVARRIGLSKGQTPASVEKDLQKILPRSQWSVAHHLLIHHGRALCHARKPECEKCPLTKMCGYFLSLPL